ncbi:MAG TPA: hypothetical protein VF211_02760 [Burkholderiales bacterium]
MKKTGLVVCVALAAACAAPEPPRGGPVDVVWQRVDDPHGACQEVSGRREVFRILGCSKWNEARADGARVCTIYAPMPRSERDTERLATLGHELMHCFDGRWHDRWGRMTRK